MKYFIKIFLFSCLAILLMSSCASTNTFRVGRTSSFLPDLIRFDLTSADVELIGEMDISVNYSQYLLFIKKFELINDMEVSSRTVNTMVMFGKRNVPLSPVLNRALYDVYLKYPDADFTVPVYVIEEQQNMFMGKKIKKTARIKAYKIKI
ncbi:MAG: hypothetical protein MUC93_10605 [Bacteroidales bacterium]|nr:hypothetical protein [Bacteroidales bacterium]